MEDVYKRQVLIELLFGYLCVNLRRLYALVSEHGADPVSYTHLDVYKRQVFWAERLPKESLR